MKSNIDFTKYKFIVSTGCSYGVVHQSFANTYWQSGGCGGNQEGMKDWLKEISIKDRFNFKDNVISISVGLSSSGARWQSESAIYTIKKLLDIGVPSENIYCFIEWSEFARVTQIIPFEYADHFENLKKKKWLDEHKIIFIPNYIDNSVEGRMENEIIQLSGGDIDAVRFLLDYIKIGRLGADITVGTIEDTMYITPSQVNLNIPSWNIKNFNEQLSWNSAITAEIRLISLVNQLFEAEKNITSSNLINDYLDNIIKTQCFLKLNNIKYNFTFINSQLADFYQNQTDGTLRYFNERGFDKRLKILNDLKNVEEVYTHFKRKIELLDLTKFSMYETETYKRGGIDELLYDKFGETIYSQAYAGDNSLKKEDKKRHRVNTPTKGHHPSELLYPFVWDFVAKDCTFITMKKEWLDLLESKFVEDYNSEEPTINGMSISKKYYEFCK